MSLKRTHLMLLLLAMGALLVLSGCAPRVGGGAVAEASADDAKLVVDLPTLVLDVDEDGQIMVGGFALADIDDAFSPGLAESLPIDAEMVKSMTDANIQHIQISPDGSTLQLLVNGMEMPTLAFDADSLAAAGVLLGVIGDQEGLDDVLPLLTQLGAGVTLNFPVDDGVAAIPMMVEGEAGAATVAAQEEFLSRVKNPPRIELPIEYAEDGTWALSGLKGKMLSALTGDALPPETLVLEQDVIDNIMAAGITSMNVSTGQDGVTIAVNEEALPTLDWSEGKLANALDVGGAFGIWDSVGEEGSLKVKAVQEIVAKLLPIIQTSEFDVNVTFPQ
jgi:hypothetical protein